MPLSAVDSVNPAIEHAKAQLFRPFRLGQWSRLALVGLLAGEMSSGGGCNSFHVPSHGGQGPVHPFPNFWVLGPLLIVLMLVAPVLWLLFLYVSSRMRFVLFDSIIAKRCEIRAMWRRRGDPAMRFFVWQIVFALVSLAGLAIIIGVPALIGFALGWFTEPRSHLAGLICGGLILFFVFMAWLLLAAVIHVFTKDFVVPQMAIEEISAFEGWSRLLKMVDAEKRGYAGYAGMKLLLAIATGIALGMVTVILLVILMIPVGGLGAITVLGGHAAGLTWNVFTITAAVVAGCVFLLVFLYCVAMISVPVIVFFPAYSIYFFAGRYPKLGSLIYPPAPAPVSPPLPPVAPIPEPGI